MLEAQVVGVSDLVRKNICYRCKGHVEPGCEETPKSGQCCRYQCVCTSAYILTSLIRLINTSLSTGTVPLAWKTANVTPVYKKGDKQDPDNYRPISVLGKVTERVVYTSLMMTITFSPHLNLNSDRITRLDDVLPYTAEDWSRVIV